MIIKQRVTMLRSCLVAAMLTMVSVCHAEDGLTPVDNTQLSHVPLFIDQNLLGTFSADTGSNTLNADVIVGDGIPVDNAMRNLFRPNIMLLFDATGSMAYGGCGTTRMECLKTAALKLIDQLKRPSTNPLAKRVRIGLARFAYKSNRNEVDLLAPLLSIDSDITLTTQPQCHSQWQFLQTIEADDKPAICNNAGYNCKKELSRCGADNDDRSSGAAKKHTSMRSKHAHKVTICHKAGPRKSFEITVAKRALPAHLRHGDHLGSCSTDASTDDEKCGGNEMYNWTVKKYKNICTASQTVTMPFSEYLKGQIKAMQPVSGGYTNLGKALKHMGRYYAGNDDELLTLGADYTGPTQKGNPQTAWPTVKDFFPADSGDKQGIATAMINPASYNTTIRYESELTADDKPDLADVTFQVPSWEIPVAGTIAGEVTFVDVESVEVRNEMRTIESMDECGRRVIAVDETQTKIPEQNHIVLLTDGDANSDGGMQPDELRFYRANTGVTVSMQNGVLQDDHKQYVVDVARALHNIDLRPNTAGKQNVVIHTIAFGSGVSNAGAVTVDMAAKEGGTNAYYPATDAAGLALAFETIIDDIQKTTGVTLDSTTPIEPHKGASGAAVAFNGALLEVGRKAYQVVFDEPPEVWNGDVRAYDLDTNSGDILISPNWQARNQISDPTTRSVLTWNADAGAGRQVRLYEDLDANQKNDLLIALNKDLSEDDVATKQANVMNKLLQLPLKDIIHSEPVFTEDAIYFGANDGMLHAINPANGHDLWSYMPNGVFSAVDKQGIHHLLDEKYDDDHRYYVDMTPTVKTTDTNTVLVSSLGGGGKSVFALDLTNTPTNLTPSEVKWEFTDSAMGYSYSRPQIAKLGGKWVTVFGNGYPLDIASSTLSPTLFTLDLTSGTTDSKVVLSGTGKGLASPLLVDIDGDGTMDRTYVGDLAGDLWAVGSDGSSRRLFKATIAGQRITTKPAIWGFKSGVIVLFGTGSYHWNGDEKDQSQQTFYGMYDDGTAGTTDITRANLVPVSVDTITVAGKTVRSTSLETIDWDTKQGWYVDLPDVGWNYAPAKQEYSGTERVVVDPVVIGGMVCFGTTVPANENKCVRGSKGWVMVLRAENGGHFEKPILDVSGDNVVNDSDTNDKVNIPTGIFFEHGMPERCRFQLKAADSSLDSHNQGTDGPINRLKIKNVARDLKRHSWREKR